MGVNKQTVCPLSDAIDDYVRFRRSTVGKATLAGDRTTLGKFLEVNGNINTSRIGDEHITRFFEAAAISRLPQSLGNDYDRLNTFFDWLRHTRRMDRDYDPMWGRPRPKGRHVERDRLHVSQFPALLDAAQQQCDRDRIGVALLLYTLGRDQEIGTLRVRDVDLLGGYLKVTVHKSGVEDRVPICAELDAELRRWLTIYAQWVGELKPHYYLVPSRKTQPIRDGHLIVGARQTEILPLQKMGPLGDMTRRALKRIDFPLVDDEGKPKREGAHTIRRSAARAVFDQLSAQGYDWALRVVSTMLHHKSTKTTEGYLGITADRRTRDELFRGKVMYDLDVSNVTPLLRQA